MITTGSDALDLALTILFLAVMGAVLTYFQERRP